MNMLTQTTATESSKLNTRVYYPWVVLSFAALFLFYKYVLQVSPSVMTQALIQHFHLHGSSLGNLAATFFYAYLVVQLFVGPLLDKYSPRLLTTLAIGVSALGGLWFAEAQTLLSASCARALIGAGAAFATVSYMKLAMMWFNPKKFAFVSGLLTTAAMLGSMAGQAPLGFLVAHFGWQTTLYVCGLIGVALSSGYYLCVRDNTSLLTSIKTPSTHDFVKLLKCKHNWQLMLYSGLAFAPLAVFGGLWGNPFLQESFHVSKIGAGTLVSCSFFGLGIGGPLLGYLSDRLHNRLNVMTLGLLLSFISLVFALYFPIHSTWLEAVFLFLFGFGTGAFMLGFSLGKEMNALGLGACVIALINTGDALFGAISEPLAGKILDLVATNKTAYGDISFTIHDYHLALLMLPLYLVAAGIFLLFLKKTCQQKLLDQRGI